MTETDKACEDLIFKQLASSFPTHEVHSNIHASNVVMLSQCQYIPSGLHYIFSVKPTIKQGFIVQLIGEETSASDGIPTLTDAPTWVVDPLDGTTNFVHRWVDLIFAYDAELTLIWCNSSSQIFKWKSGCWLCLISALLGFCDNRFPFVCVSIGLVINKVPAVGVVYNPILDEVLNPITYFSLSVLGAWLRASKKYVVESERCHTWLVWHIKCR